MKKITATNTAVKAPIYANPALKSQAEVVDSATDFNAIKDSRGVHLTGYGFKEGVEIFIEDKPAFSEDPNNRQVLATWPAYDGQKKANWPLYVQVIRRQGNRCNYSWLNLNRLTDHSFVTGKTGEYVDEFRKTMDNDYNSHMERLEALRGCVIIPEGTNAIPSYRFNPDVRGEYVLDENGERIVDNVDHVTVSCTLEKLSEEDAKAYQVD